MDDEGISPVEVSISRKFFSPTRNRLAGIKYTPAISPAAVVVNRPIEYTESVDGVVVHVPVIATFLVAAAYADIVACWPTPVP